MSDTTTTNIKVNLDASQALAQINNLSQSISNFNKSVLTSSQAAVNSQAAFNKALAANVIATRQFGVSFGTAQTSVKNFSQSLESGKLSFGEYIKYGVASTKKFSSVFKTESQIVDQLATQRVKKLQTQYVALGQTVDGVTKVMKITPNQLAPGLATDIAISTQKAQIFNKILRDGSTGLINWGKNTQWAGRQLMVGFSIPLAMFASKAMKAFKELETQAIRFKSVYGDMFTTPAQAEKALDDVKKLAAEMTKYGIAVADTVKMAADAAAAGKQGADLMSTVSQAMRLSTLGQVGQQESLTTIISLQNAYKISSKDLGSAIDYLNAVENQSVLSLQDVTAAIPRLGPIVRQLGGDIRDTTVFLAAMKEGGISAEQGANALKSGLASIINPTKKAQETLKGFGIDIVKIVQDNEGNLMGMVTSVAEAFNKLSGLQKQQAMETLFGKFQFAKVGAMLDNITQKGSQANQVLGLAQTSAIELAALSQKELLTIETSPVTKLKKAFEDLKITLAPIGKTFVEMSLPLIKFGEKIASLFASVPKPIKQALVFLFGLGPLLTMLVGLAANFVGNMFKFLLGINNFFKRLAGGGKDIKYLSDSQLEAAASAASLEKGMSSVTRQTLLQKEAYQRLIAVLSEYATLASSTAAINPAGFARMPGTVPMKMASGGKVPGAGSGDTQPALLTPGEFVMNKKAVQRFGPILHAMNTGSIGMFEGGLSEGGGGQSIFPPSLIASLSNLNKLGSMVSEDLNSTFSKGKQLLREGITEASTKLSSDLKLMLGDVGAMLEQKIFEASRRERFQQGGSMVGKSGGEAAGVGMIQQAHLTPAIVGSLRTSGNKNIKPFTRLSVLEPKLYKSVETVMKGFDQLTPTINSLEGEIGKVGIKMKLYSESVLGLSASTNNALAQPSGVSGQVVANDLQKIPINTLYGKLLNVDNPAIQAAAKEFNQALINNLLKAGKNVGDIASADTIELRAIVEETFNSMEGSMQSLLRPIMDSADDFRAVGYQLEGSLSDWQKIAARHKELTGKTVLTMQTGTGGTTTARVGDVTVGKFIAGKETASSYRYSLPSSYEKRFMPYESGSAQLPSVTRALDNLKMTYKDLLTASDATWEIIIAEIDKARVSLSQDLTKIPERMKNLETMMNEAVAEINANQSDEIVQKWVSAIIGETLDLKEDLTFLQNFLLKEGSSIPNLDAKNFANVIKTSLSTVNSFLGIKSPSTVIAAELEKTAEGIAQGVILGLKTGLSVQEIVGQLKSAAAAAGVLLSDTAAESMVQAIASAGADTEGAVKQATNVARDALKKGTQAMTLPTDLIALFEGFGHEIGKAILLGLKTGLAGIDEKVRSAIIAQVAAAGASGLPTVQQEPKRPYSKPQINVVPNPQVASQVPQPAVPAGGWAKYQEVIQQKELEAAASRELTNQKLQESAAEKLLQDAKLKGISVEELVAGTAYEQSQAAKLAAQALLDGVTVEELVTKTKAIEAELAERLALEYKKQVQSILEVSAEFDVLGQSTGRLVNVINTVKPLPIETPPSTKQIVPNTSQVKTFNNNLFAASMALSSLSMIGSMAGGSLAKFSQKLMMASSILMSYSMLKGALGPLATRIGAMTVGTTTVSGALTAATPVIAGLAVAAGAAFITYKTLTRDTRSFTEKLRESVDVYSKSLESVKNLTAGVDFLTAAGLKRKGSYELNTEGTQFAGKTSEDLFKLFKIDTSSFAKSANVMKDVAFSIFNGMQTMDMSTKDLDVFITQFAMQIAKMGNITVSQAKTKLMAEVTKMYVGNVDALKEPITIEFLGKFINDPGVGIDALTNQIDEAGKAIDRSLKLSGKAAAAEVEKARSDAEKTRGKYITPRGGALAPSKYSNEALREEQKNIDKVRERLKFLREERAKTAKERRETGTLKYSTYTANGAGGFGPITGETTSNKQLDSEIKKAEEYLRVRGGAVKEVTSAVEEANHKEKGFAESIKDTNIAYEKNQILLSQALSIQHQLNDALANGKINQAKYNELTNKLAPAIQKATDRQIEYIKSLNVSQLDVYIAKQKEILKLKGFTDEQVNAAENVLASAFSFKYDEKKYEEDNTYKAIIDAKKPDAEKAGKALSAYFMKALSEGRMTSEDIANFAGQFEDLPPIIQSQITSNPDLAIKFATRVEADPQSMQDLAKVGEIVEKMKIPEDVKQQTISLLLKAPDLNSFLAMLPPAIRNFLTNPNAPPLVKELYLQVTEYYKGPGASSGNGMVSGIKDFFNADNIGQLQAEYEKQHADEIKQLEDQIKKNDKDAAKRIEKESGKIWSDAFAKTAKNMKLPGLGGGIGKGPLVADLGKSFKITIPSATFFDATGAVVKLDSKIINAEKSMNGLNDATFELSEYLEYLNEIEFGLDQKIKEADREIKKLQDDFDTATKKAENLINFGANDQGQANKPGFGKAYLNMFNEVDRQAALQGKVVELTIKPKADWKEFTYESIKDKIPKISAQDMIDIKSGKKIVGIEDFQKMFKLPDEVLKNGQAYLKILDDYKNGVAGGKEAWDSLGASLQQDIEALQEFADKAEIIGQIIERNLTAKFNIIKQKLETDWKGALDDLLAQGEYNTKVQVQLEPGIDAKGLDNKALKAKFDALVASLPADFKIAGQSFEQTAQAIEDAAKKSSDAVEQKYKVMIDSTTAYWDGQIKALQDTFDAWTKQTERDWDDATTQMERDWDDATESIQKGFDKQREAADETYQKQREALESMFDTAKLEEEKQQLLDKTNQAFDSQIDALSEISRYEQFITDQKSQQVDLATAIAQGDIAAAAKAAGSMTQSQSQFSKENMSKSLSDARDVANKQIEDEYKTRIDAQNKAKDAAIKILEEQHKKDMDDMQTSFDERMKKRSRDHEDAMKIRQRQHEDDMEKIRTSHQAQIDNLNTQKQNAIDALNNQKQNELDAISTLKDERKKKLDEFEKEVKAALDERETYEKQKISDVTKDLREKELGTYKDIKTEVDGVGSKVDDTTKLINGSLKTGLDYATARWLDQKNFAEKQKSAIADVRDDVNTITGAFNTSKNNVDNFAQKVNDTAKALNSIAQEKIDSINTFAKASPGDALKMLSNLADKKFSDLPQSWKDLINAATIMAAKEQNASTYVDQATGQVKIATTPTSRIPEVFGTGDSQTGDRPSDRNTTSVMQRSPSGSTPQRTSSSTSRPASSGGGGSADDDYIRNRYIGGAKDLLPESLTGLDSGFKRKVLGLLKEFPSLRINSAFRPAWYQARLWNDALQRYGSESVARKWVAPPGRSMHGPINGVGGRAMDFAYPNGGMISKVHEAASKYGLKFPLGNENWHVEDDSTRDGEDIVGDVDNGVSGNTLTQSFTQVSYPSVAETAQAALSALLTGQWPDYATWPKSTVVNVPMVEVDENGNPIEQSTGPLSTETDYGTAIGQNKNYPPPGKPGTKLTTATLLSLAKAAGFIGETARVAAAVMMAESSGYTRQHNWNPPSAANKFKGTNDYGLWQFNDGGTLQSYAKTLENALNPAAATQAAYSLWKARGFQPWYGYTKGGYLNHLKNIPGAATGAVVAPTPGGTPYIVGEGGQTEVISPVPTMLQTMITALSSFFTGDQFSSIFNEVTRLFQNIKLPAVLPASLLGTAPTAMAMPQNMTQTYLDRIKAIDDQKSSNLNALNNQKTIDMGKIKAQKDAIQAQIDQAKAAGKTTAEIQGLQDQMDELNRVQATLLELYDKATIAINNDSIARKNSVIAEFNATKATNTATTATANNASATTTNAAAVSNSTDSVDNFTSSLTTIIGEITSFGSSISTAASALGSLDGYAGDVNDTLTQSVNPALSDLWPIVDKVSSSLLTMNSSITSVANPTRGASTSSVGASSPTMSVIPSTTPINGAVAPQGVTPPSGWVIVNGKWVELPPAVAGLITPNSPPVSNQTSTMPDQLPEPVQGVGNTGSTNYLQKGKHGLWTPQTGIYVTGDFQGFDHIFADRYPNYSEYLRNPGGYSTGGMVPQYYANGGGPKGTDTVPAWLTPGEFVIRKDVAEKFKNILPEFNKTGKWPKYAMGGMKVPEYMATGGTVFGNMFSSITSIKDAILGSSNIDTYKVSVNPESFSTNTVNSPMYNINVSVQSNADPDQIANTIARTMRRENERNIKVYRK